METFSHFSTSNQLDSSTGYTKPLPAIGLIEGDRMSPQRRTFRSTEAAKKHFFQNPLSYARTLSIVITHFVDLNVLNFFLCFSPMLLVSLCPFDVAFGNRKLWRWSATKLVEVMGI